MKKLSQLFFLMWEKDWAFIPMGILLTTILYYLHLSCNFINWQEKSATKLTSWQAATTQVFFGIFHRLDLGRAQQISELKLQNQILKQALLNSQKFSSHQILSYPFHLISTINGDRLKTGSIVTVDGVLLGLISQSTAYAAKVDLINEASLVPILVITDSGANGLVAGDGRKLVLTQIPNTINLQLGEKVLTLGQLEIKSGLLLGFVGESVGAPTDPTKKYIINQPLDFNNLTEVEVF